MTLDEGRLQRAWDIAHQLTTDGIGASWDSMQHRAGVTRLPVAALGVATSETTVTRAFGQADGQDITDRHQFLLASISKPITGLAVMKLVEQGHVVLSQAIQGLIPEFHAPGKPDVTPWHLMTHTSGLPDLAWEGAGTDSFAFDALVQRAVDSVPQFRPGTHWLYNTRSFYLLGLLVERTDGRDLETFLREEILAPNGITGIGFDPDANGAPSVMPTNLSPDPRISQEQARRIMIGAKMPGAGFWSDMESLLGLGQALLRDARDGGGRILARPTLDLMTRLHTDGIPKWELGATTPGRYGLTWHKPTTTRDIAHPGSESAFNHSGATGTVLWVDPEHDLSVVFLTNVWGVGDDSWMRCLQAIYAAWRP